jgi:O-antigen/teichoic acid export membrane protein
MKEVVLGSGIAFFFKVIGAFLSFCFSILFARLFGAEGAGVFFLALTVTTVAVSVGNFGLQNTILRHVAANAAKREWSAVKGVYIKGMGIALIVSILLMMFLYAGAHILSVNLFGKTDLEEPLRLMTLCIPPLTLLLLQSEALKGLGHIRDSQILQGVAVPGLVCLGLLLANDVLTVPDAAFVYVIASYISVAAGCWLWRKYTWDFRASAPSFPSKEIFSSCIPLFWVQLMSAIINWVSVFCLGVWGSQSDVGVFSAALRTSMITSLILVSVNSIAAPKFSALYFNGDFSKLSATAKSTTAMMILLSTPILILLILFSGTIMSLFGQEFRQGGPLLLIMAIGQFINVATGPVGYLLSMSGNERLLRNNTIIFGIVTIFLNVWLVPAYGIIGAAIATMASMSLINLGAFYLVWKILGIWTFPFWGPKIRKLNPL